MTGGILGRIAHPALLALAQVATGIVFLAAGLGKLGDVGGFAQQVHNYRIVPIWTENLMALTLPWIEVVAGLALVLRVRPRAGALVATVLTAIFTIAVAAAWARGLDFECGCFGKASASRIGAQKLLENLGLLALCLVGTLRAAAGRGR